MRGYIVFMTLSVTLSFGSRSIATIFDGGLNPAVRVGIASLEGSLLQPENVPSEPLDEIAPPELDAGIRREALKSWPRKKPAMTIHLNAAVQRDAQLHKPSSARSRARILLTATTPPPSALAPITQQKHKPMQAGVTRKTERSSLSQPPTVQLWIEPHAQQPRQSEGLLSSPGQNIPLCGNTAAGQRQLGSEMALPWNGSETHQMPQTLSPMVLPRVISAKGIRHSKTLYQSAASDTLKAPITLRATQLGHSKGTHSRARFRMNTPSQYKSASESLVPLRDSLSHTLPQATPRALPWKSQIDAKQKFRTTRQSGFEEHP